MKHTANANKPIPIFNVLKIVPQILFFKILSTSDLFKITYLNKSQMFNYLYLTIQIRVK